MTSSLPKIGGGGSLSEGEIVGEEPIELLGEEPLDEEILAAGDVVKDSERNIAIDDRVDETTSVDDAGVVASSSVTGEENRNDNTNEDPSENAEMRDEAAISDTVTVAEEPIGQVAEHVDAMGGESVDEEAPDLNFGMSVSAKRATAGDTLSFSLRVSDNGGPVAGRVYLANIGTGEERSVSVRNFHWEYPGGGADGVKVVGDEAVGRGPVAGRVYLANIGTGEERSVSVRNFHWEYPGGGADGVKVVGDEAVGTERVTDSWTPGEWVATGVWLQDDSNNQSWYYAPGHEPSWSTDYDWQTADLSALSFEVYGTKLDSEAPVLGAVSESWYYAPGHEPSWSTDYDWQTADLSALSFEVYGTKLDSEAPVLGAVSVSVKRVASGGNVTMTLKTEGHDVAEASIVYRAPQSGSSVEVPLSAKSDGVMAGTMEITDHR